MTNESTQQFIRIHRLADVRKLALQTGTMATSDIDIRYALQQIEGRQFIENKIPTWFLIDDIVYPAHLSLEQCSSEMTARYKADLLSGNFFVDLTGGFGIDFAFISQKFKAACYIEKQEELCKIAAHNFPILDLNTAKIENTNAVEYLKQMPAIDAIFIDPGRRSDSGKKTVAIENCEPDLSLIQDLLLEKAENVLIKLSPMLDISQALSVLKNVAEVHVVSLENECKELLFLLKRNVTGEPKITCVNLNKKNNQPEIAFYQSQERESHIEYTSQIERYIYEPNASILKAGYYKGLALSYPIRKLHPDSHLYTSEKMVSDFPGRIFQVEAYSSFNKKDLKNFLSNINKANIAVRNFPLSVAELRKKWKIKEGSKVYLFATTLANGKHVLVKNQKYTPKI
jgi:16S rRNA G966 N2-methylase RsmD